MEKKGFLSQVQMKYIVIVLMVLDHVAHHMINPESALYLSFRFISRLTAPTMAFFIAEGYVHTTNLKKYIERLGIFSIIAWFPFCYFQCDTFIPIKLLSGNLVNSPNALDYCLYLKNIDKTLMIGGLSVFTSLFLGLLAIVLWDKVKIHWAYKFILTIGILWLSLFADWIYYDVLFCLIFYFLRDKKIPMWTMFTLVALIYIFNLSPFREPFAIGFNIKLNVYRIGTLLNLLFIPLCYSGKLGKKSAFNKWFFYVFYPGHFLILALINNFILK